MMATRLGDFQAQFREFLYRGKHERELAAQVRAGGPTSPIERLDVYRHAYFIRLERALAHDFPVTEKMLGKKAFAHFAGDYALAHPSGSPNLRAFGHSFSAWLRVEENHMLSDLAAIEWAALQVVDGPDAKAVDTHRLQTFAPEDWPRLDIRLVPTLALLALTSNADSVWLAKGEDIELEATTTRYIALWRDEHYRPLLVEVDPDSYAVLTVLAKSSRLVVASERLATQLDPAAVPQRMAAALHQALAHGWVAAIDVIN